MPQLTVNRARHARPQTSRVPLKPFAMMPTPNFQQLASNSLPRLDTASCRRMPLSTDNINERGTKPLRVTVQRELAYQGDTSRPDQTVTPLGTASLAASDNTYYVVRS